MPKHLFFALVLVTACSPQPPQDHGPGTSDRVPAAGSIDPSTNAPLDPPAPGEPGGLPDDRTPVPEGPIDPKSAQGAAQVLQHYFALIEQRRYAEAYALWSDGGRASGMTAADFAASFDEYREYHANIGAPGQTEGAAGSIYVDVPVQLYGRRRDGQPFNELITLTLRRVNDVPGSTEAQRQWHIARTTATAPADGTPYRFVGDWATDVRRCATEPWRFTAVTLDAPAGVRCTFTEVHEVPGGYDVAARCIVDGRSSDDTLELRFAESAKALLLESSVVADAGLVRCAP